MCECVLLIFTTEILLRCTFLKNKDAKLTSQSFRECDVGCIQGTIKAMVITLMFNCDFCLSMFTNKFSIAQVNATAL